MFKLRYILTTLAWSLYSISVISQPSDGEIDFDQKLGWEEIKKVAKKENKSIFVDVYATWCIPCKNMDRTVFLDSAVGAQMNAQFISVKMQLDTSARDDATVKARYADASLLTKDFRVKSVPTYLFFSPEGEVVHRGEGQLSTSRFLQLANQALNPDSQAYTVVRRYKHGTSHLSSVIRAAKLIGEDSLVLALTDTYLDNLDSSSFFDPSMLTFNLDLINHSNSRAFGYLFARPDKVDSLLGDMAVYDAASIIRKIIITEEVLPLYEQRKLSTSYSPKWRKLKRRIEMRFSREHANWVVRYSKIPWYQSEKNWSAYSTSVVEFVEAYKPDIEWFFLNNYCWEIFKRSNRKSELRKAISWQKALVDTLQNPNEFDTYANLLYKIGEIDSAINWQKKAIGLQKQLTARHGHKENPAFTENLDKMYRRIPTWPVD